MVTDSAGSVSQIDCSKPLWWSGDDSYDEDCSNPDPPNFGSSLHNTRFHVPETGTPVITSARGTGVALRVKT